MTKYARKNKTCVIVLISGVQVTQNAQVLQALVYESLYERADDFLCPYMSRRNW